MRVHFKLRLEVQRVGLLIVLVVVTLVIPLVAYLENDPWILALVPMSWVFIPAMHFYWAIWFSYAFQSFVVKALPKQLDGPAIKRPKDTD